MQALILFQIIISILIGIFMGMITGLTPGVHINTVIAIVLGLSLSRLINPLLVSLFIIATAVTHTFLDVIPSTFLGAPDAATALGVLPGHRYLIRGYGLQAVKLAVIGSLFGLILSIIAYPLFRILTYTTYSFVKNKIWVLLVIISIFMIWKSKYKLKSLIVYSVSGFLGWIVLNSYITNPLQPMLSGLFGASTLLYSLKSKTVIPQQIVMNHTKFNKKRAFKAVISGQLSGFITAILPGIGSAQAIVIAMNLAGNIGDHGFMILMGATSTVNFVLSIAALEMINKARNGAILAVQGLINPKGLIVLFLAVALVAGSLASMISISVAKAFARVINILSYNKLSIILLLFLTIMSGFQGLHQLVIFITSSAIGLIPAIWKTSRANAMACLLVPVILWGL